jgi:hypothetical protein
MRALSRGDPGASEFCRILCVVRTLSFALFCTGSRRTNFMEFTQYQDSGGSGILKVGRHVILVRVVAKSSASKIFAQLAVAILK